MSIRCRYAPSPTGNQHIGGLRTALFNYLLARGADKAAGQETRGANTFILRLEDTDRQRFDEAYVKNIYDTFDWLGFRWDEGPDTGGPRGPYIQSERLKTYQEHAARLVETGAAYHCFCSAERLETLRKTTESGYDRACRALPPEEARRRALAGERGVIRLKIPLEEHTRFTDALLGPIEWKNSEVSPDPVLLKSDGFPTYHLANVVDDHLMNVTHVLRAQEWLSSTPMHIILYQASGWAPPVFCHLPMVMGQDGKKLSKRHGATSVNEFRKAGYLARALINYVALLGASYREGQELYTLDELAALFSLNKLNKAAAVFDYKKLDWFNAQYIKAAPDAELAALALPFAIEAGLFAGGAPTAKEHALFSAAMPLVKERAILLSDIPPKLAFLFTEPPPPPAEEFIPKKASRAQARSLLELGRALLDTIAGANDEQAEALAKEAAAREGVKIGDLLMPLRVALTGSRVSPPLFGSARLLGPQQCRARVEKALTALE